MALSLAAFQVRIEELQKRVDAAKAKEAVVVIARARTAIAFYGLTPADLFDTDWKTKTTAAAKGAVPARENNAVTKRSPSVVKYRDEAGNSWSGHGKRPNWFNAAVLGGKTAEKLLVKTE